MNQDSFDGNFLLERQHDRWRLRSDAGALILLHGAQIDAREARRRVHRVTLTWLAEGGADVELSGGGAPLALRAAEVIVHQPLPGLYAGLPLATYDARSRRFWQRVFWLARLPGGGALLKFLARRTRAKA